MENFDLSKEAIESFVDNVKGSVLGAKEKYGAVYLAIIATADGTTVEVEISEGEIVDGFWLGNVSLETARDVASEIERVINEKTGCPVCQTRKEWENALEAYYEGEEFF
jgi:hypothetical protein